MDAAAARAAGQPDVFGMGNLRIAYLHNLAHQWLAGRGDLIEFRCQFRALNFKGDTLTARARVAGKREADGARLVDLEMDVVNQKGESTTPAAATLLLFDARGARALPAPPPAALKPPPAPGVHLDPDTLAWLNRPLEPIEALPVGANDIRRWAMATWYPQPVPPEFYDEAAAARGPWGGLVAPRDFNPFAWTLTLPPDRYPWMRGMGTEPGRRGLNGGQRNRYYAPIRPGDRIRSTVTLIDAYEKQGRLGTMLFLIDEARWTNQRGELVRVGERTSIYY
jgi:acyl dehydratase